MKEMKNPKTRNSCLGKYIWWSKVTAFQLSSLTVVVVREREVRPNFVINRNSSAGRYDILSSRKLCRRNEIKLSLFEASKTWTTHWNNLFYDIMQIIQRQTLSPWRVGFTFNVAHWGVMLINNCKSQYWWSFDNVTS